MLIGWYCFVTNTSYSQCETLITIINSEGDKNTKKEKIQDFLNQISLDDKNELADCYHELGSKWYYSNWLEHNSMSELEEAIGVTQKSLKYRLSEKMLDTLGVKKSFYNIGFYNSAMNNHFEAIRSFKDIVLFGGGDAMNLDARKFLGLEYLELGDFNKAILEFEEILLDASTNSSYWEQALNAHILLADTFGSMDYRKYEKTIFFHLTQADSIVREKKLMGSYEDLETKLIRGNTFLKNNDYKSALINYQYILDNPAAYYPEEMAGALNNLGYCLIKIDSFDMAKQYLLKSLDLDSSLSSPYEGLGDLYLQMNLHKKCIEYYHKAIYKAIEVDSTDLLERLPSVNQLKTANNKIVLLNHLIKKAKGWLSYFEVSNNEEQLEHALDTFKVADALIDIIRNETTEFQSKLYWREQSSKLYINAVKTCFLLENSEEAFYFMERNKAILLLEDITEERAKKIAKIPDSLSQRIFGLSKQILKDERKLREGDSIAELRKSLFLRKNELERLNQLVKNKYPAYVRIKNEIELTSFTDFKDAHCDHSNAALQFILGGETGYGLLSTAEESILFELESVDSLKSDLNQLKNTYLNTTPQKSMKDQDFTLLSEKTTNQLFTKNVWKKIMGKNLLIIPDGELQQVPLDYLYVPKSKNRRILEETAVSYAYSISLLESLKATESHEKMNFLGIAPGNFQNAGLLPLDFSVAEVSAIASIMDGTELIKANATKNRFLEEFGSKGIVHLSTHANIGENDDHWIAFEDGKLFMDELYAQTTKAKMVVLSACNTSVGKIAKGEGVMSIARTFFNNGAQSLVSSLWSVNDETTKEIMVHFYKNLKKGYSKSKSLQRAKLEYLETVEAEELKHPYHWAGFVVIGDDSPIVQKSNLKWWLTGGAVFILIMALGYRKIKVHRAVA